MSRSLPVNPTTLPRRSVGEWHVASDRSYGRPFHDVEVWATFVDPAGESARMPAFYDGDGVWKIRFNPSQAGVWSMTTGSRPANPDLEQQFEFTVEEREARGFLQSAPDKAWGYTFENGEGYFPFGDTVYNLFGMKYCGYDVDAFLERRAAQGFNLLRVRLPVSRFHPPAGISEWQTRSTWPWGGSEQAPMFEEFNLDYFHTVDDVVLHAESLEIGLEMIMEAWGFEFPFNSRQIFTAERELLWLRYLVARYDAFTCTYFWTPQNEYEYYPNGDWNYKDISDDWQLRISRWLRETAPHGHCIAAHNGPTMPPFVERFAHDPDAVDTIMYQNWGDSGEEGGWLATGLEDGIRASLRDWPASAILAEWGYERNEALSLNVPGHIHCDQDHTRRGAWRGVFSGMGIIHGFENTWGPWCVLDEDQPGIVDLGHVAHFVRDVVRDSTMHPTAGGWESTDREPGHTPLMLASDARDLVLVYAPAGGTIPLADAPAGDVTYAWYDPRTGETSPASPDTNDGSLAFTCPGSADAAKPDDWILVADARSCPES